MTVKINPRNDLDFVEGIDNLTPAVNLRDIVYINLGTCEQDSIGILQLVNKTKGSINKQEEELIEVIGPVIGNFLSMIMVNLRYQLKMEDLMSSYETVKDVVNSDLFQYQDD